jgi:hypothetical protein
MSSKIADRAATHKERIKGKKHIGLNALAARTGRKPNEPK